MYPTRKRILNARLLQSAAAVGGIIVASVGTGQAQTSNLSGPQVDSINLLAPFLTLDSTPVGQETLSKNLDKVIWINNNASMQEKSLAISDETRFIGACTVLGGSACPHGTVPPNAFGAAANLAGPMPSQNPVNGITPQQPVGGFGQVLGPIYVNGVDPNNPMLSGTVNLLKNAVNNLTEPNADAAKFYFANGTATVNGSQVPAVAPPGYTLPTFDSLPNAYISVYDNYYINIAHGSYTDYRQNPYIGDSRPFQVSSQVNAIDSGQFIGNQQHPAFPSGHTTYAYTDSILLGMLVPELYQSMMVRASEFANSRIVLGVHYPTDIIGGRALASYSLAQALNNPDYVSGTDLQSLFIAAQPQLRDYLSNQCGDTIANCATSTANTTNNPYVPSAANQALYQSRLTYGLPTLSFAEAPREAAPIGGPDASILLATLYGGSTMAANNLAPNGGILGSLQTDTINQIIVNTETNALAAFYGTALSYWARIDLYSAAGYFQNVTGVLTLAQSDLVTTNVTIGSDGILGGSGTIMGNTTVNSGGGLTGGVPNAPGYMSSPGMLTIKGDLQFNAGSNYLVQLNPSAASLVNVIGAANVADGAQASAYLAPGIYTVGSKIPVLTTTDGLTGTFGDLTFNSTGVNVVPKLSYDNEDVYLTLAQASLPTLAPGAPSNSMNVENALNAAIANGAVLPASLQNLFILSPTGLANALNQIGGQTSNAASQSAFASMNSFLGLIFDSGGGTGTPGTGPETAIGYAAAPQVAPEVALAYAAVTPKDRLLTKAPPSPVWAGPSWGAWGSTFGGVARLDGDAALGSQNLTSRLFGAAAGADYRLFPDTKIGFALAGGETKYSLANGFGSGRADFFQGSLYAKAHYGPAYLTAALAGGTQWVESDRTVAIGPAIDMLKAQYTMPTFAGRVEGGYRFGSVAYGFTPYAA